MGAPIAQIVTNPNRRGACPTLDAPMQTGDGLLARMHITGNRLTPPQLAELARLAIAHGNGIVEITARGNLQIRGLTPASAPLLARAVSTSLPIETGLVVDISPLVGDDPTEKTDPRPLADAIHKAAVPMEGKLGPKVSVVMDSGGQISLAALKADIRLLAVETNRWAVTLGGGKPQVMDAEGAVSATIAVLGALAALGIEARAADLFPASRVPSPHPIPPRKGEGAGPVLDAISSPSLDAAPPPLRGRMGGGGHTLETLSGHTTPIPLPFAQIHGSALIALADLAAAANLNTIRLAPNHTLLLDNAPAGLITAATELGFITDPADPRRRVSACVGNEGCASGHIAARRLGATLAPHIPPGKHLHVSGCAKGCAHPRPADITLVGRADGIGLVFHGRAGDTPDKIVDEAGLVPALARREGR
jgi:precorrin-3B synthase